MHGQNTRVGEVLANRRVELIKEVGGGDPY